MSRITRKHQWTGSSAPATLDWVVERAKTERPALLRPARPLPLPIQQVPKSIEWIDLLERWQEDLGVDWNQVRAIEIEDRFPKLAEFFEQKEAKEHLALVGRAEIGLANWASRFPGARFFEGSLSTFARLAPNRFDWASHLSTDVNTLSNIDNGMMGDLSRLLRRRGLLFVRSSPRSREEWVFYHALHQRSQLRILGCEELADGTHLVISRRR